MAALNWGTMENSLDPMIDEASAAILDNPIWGALTTDHVHLAVGGDTARRYREEIGPLSGMPEQSDVGYGALTPLFSPGEVAVLFFREEPRVPEAWTLVRGGMLVQMVAQQPKLVPCVAPDGVELRKLTTDDAPAMVELAKLTEPGPFRLRTMELGTFFGIFEAGRLLAMAGKRLHVPGFVEVSGVCTHPDARGRGYARLLMSCVMEEIIGAGKTPFLHAFGDNHGAIRVYEALGFQVRRTFELAAVKKQPVAGSAHSSQMLA
jgi:ribosomal protein S18 acetylase RimI-like enzyme